MQHSLLKSMALCSCLLLTFTACKKKETTFPVVKDITVSVYAPGRLVDKEAYLLYAPASGLLNQWHAAEGDTLTAGQLVASIENNNSALNRENADIRLAEIARNLKAGSSFRKDLDLSVANALSKMEDDSANFDRQNRLWEKGVGTKREWETRKFAWENAQRQYRSAVERRNLQIEQLKSEYRTAKNMLDIAENQNMDYRVESKIKGVLAEQTVKAGEIVLPQQPIGRIGGTAPFQLELEVDEVDIANVKEGQLAIVALDAYPDEVFPGRVTYISTQKDPQVQSFRIEVAFVERPPKAFDGMTAEANVVIAEKKNVLLIPQSYVLPDNKVVNKDGDTLKLELGLSDMEYVEVLGGLDLQTEIQKPGS